MTSSPPVAPIHLRPTAELAERVLLPGDPGRALALAQSLLQRPLMFNHHRGLWGYTGAAADGEPLTIQSTGMGGPSAAIVLSELIALGVRRAIRVGTCGALDRSLRLGDLVLARDSISSDGASRALGAGERAYPDGPLTEALARVVMADSPADLPPSESGLPVPGSSPPSEGSDMQFEPPDARPRDARARQAHFGTVVTVDLFYEPDPERGALATAPAALAVEMEAAALFALGAHSGIPVACLLAVSDTFSATGTRHRIDDESLLRTAETMGTLAVAGFAG